MAAQRTESSDIPDQAVASAIEAARELAAPGCVPLNELEFLILKRIVHVGSHGIRQPVLFSRLPPCREQTRIRAVAGLEAFGYLRKGQALSSTSSSRYENTWTATEDGRTAYDVEVRRRGGSPNGTASHP